ncbi:MAG: LacI family DNA-binding transcriptional regulator [Opitutaceae bacterium]|jgi:DNA-binding LacI/PurR family transcriptional regulator
MKAQPIVAKSKKLSDPISRAPTIRDVAAKLGVSHTTVSLSLRNHTSIPHMTRKRVQEGARKMGYRSNILVSALLTQVRSRHVHKRGEVIAWLTATPIEEWQQLPSISMGLTASKQRAEQVGIRTDAFFIGTRGEHWPQVRRMLEARGVRGLLFPPVPWDFPALDIPWDRFSVMTISYSFRQANLHRVLNAHFNGMITCYKKLRLAKRKRIGLVLLRDDDDRAHHYWLSGFLAAPHLFGGATLRPLLLKTVNDRNAFGSWFGSQRPDAIIGLNKHYISKWLGECGARIPADICYVSLDAGLDASQPEAGIRQSWGEIFSTAIELIAGQLARNEVGLPAMPRVTLIDGLWSDGPSMEQV